ncbi:c-type cytochrome [Lyngbya confervoides BDU141951]|uniref:Cytochrome c6 n=1 Tax=Lyngbya confervoides BDU141951 TaxID=1574623 RepID=A0ABD4T7I5_9CYAN|nr:c-type cytochrome [Lyngbya confervoides]MCM1984729.1 c-type cytochrome [Lyngbya confervoides BDU141951]
MLSAVFALIPAFLLLLSSPAFAADAGAGAQVFSANCAACHAGGGNVINPAKTLAQKDLEANGKDTADAIITQVTNGYNAMPAFGGRLSPSDIENVAAYVLDQAAKGW